MNIAMTEKEQNLFFNFLGQTHSYMEFGSGGSTVAASRLTDGPIISIDSSREWLSNVSDNCVPEAQSRMRLVHVDIGPLENWGRPADQSRRDHWPDYHTNVWSRLEKTQVDSYLVDGRFRVACFIQSMFHATADSVVLVHDFTNRPHYHVMREFGREIASAERLSAFVRRPTFDSGQARLALESHSYDFR